MRKLEGLVKEIVDELGYLKKREERFQNTNSARLPLSSPLLSSPLPFLFPRAHAFLTVRAVSTNARVQNFAWFSLFALLGLGAWQIVHLRSFFKRKYLID